MQERKSNVIKSAALILCICVAAALFFSTWFILSHADHDCTGDQCPVCAEIQTAENLLKQVGLVGFCILFSFSNHLSSYSSGKYTLCYVNNITPVTLKVRMNN
ncbi:hypothetical protein CDQ84_12650 [Clostridium thermosuccinogenes]|uniref:Uncharacterized protein n=1 Tax=Clostridium thermosuccinogenes TaxID=84032 RepID=A0A2K2FBC4_9CLOT|nr:hypothetical protein [Pseudoclostridium thermosuccinogenes]AUS97040.1 hypothetical protein CDO33_11690 [Pseudoclostridium thermosuccinogenes]PNT96086.1 hypothetical protein CDQ85_12690 [Pseudoclostridium thermosuccinogenes]PNT97697.1 hypothetical protein CDQ84_12650 [Pseudoclostridium thermosuccinogenes]